MRILSAVIGCAVVVGASVAIAADADLPALQGKWVVESFQYNGTSVDVMKDAVREFKEDKYTLTQKSGEVINGAVKLDSTKKPKTIDLEVNSQTLKGIYELEGDTLKMCYRLGSDGERPTEFDSSPDSSLVLVIHKRSK